MHPPTTIRPDGGRVRARARPALMTLLRTLLVASSVAACVGGPTGPTPRPVAGTEASPRDVNIVAKDYEFIPAEVDLVAGETVLFHLLNGGLAVHEVVIGDQAVQNAWEAAEAQSVDAPPGPTPVVSVPPGLAGLRVVLVSGQRVDVRWTVPRDVGPSLIVGCHIPGHYAKGMHVPIVLVAPATG